MECPLCSETLESQQIHGIEIDVCGGCSGAWFDAGELESYRVASGAKRGDHSVPALEPSYGGERSKCPRCATKSIAVGKLRDTAVHQCLNCSGIFLSHRELEQISSSKMERFTDGAIDGAAHNMFEIAIEVLGELLSGL